MTLEILVQIAGSNPPLSFCAAVVARDGRVVEAAPYLKFMRGWTGAHVAAYCARKGWQWTRIDGHLTPDGVIAPMTVPCDSGSSMARMVGATFRAKIE